MITNWTLFLWAIGIFAVTCSFPFIVRDLDGTKEDSIEWRLALFLLDGFGTVLSLILAVQAISIRNNAWIETFVVLTVYVVGSWGMFKLGYPRLEYFPDKEKKNEQSDSSVSGEGTG